MTSAGEYPSDLESDVVLADGRVGHVRPILASDVAGLRDLGSKLSAESIYLRFFSPRRQISDAELQHFANVDYDRRLALIALVDGELVAVARYDREEGAKIAEVAFTVRDDQQGRGLGMVLLEHLASAARDRGITRFEADTLAVNEAMLRVFRRAGFEEKTAFGAGVVHVTLDLDPVPGYLEQLEERDRRAAVRSIERLLRPRAIAVVGASNQAGFVGHEIVANLLAGKFTGPVYPVKEEAGGTPGLLEICGLPVFDDVADIEGPVDLAVIAVPVAEVLRVTEACGKKGVSGLVVVTAGFAEAGAEGAAAERQFVSLARSYGMRVIGPNCLGVVNTAPEVSMNATFSPARPVPGPIGFSSQSGGLGIAILEEATRRDLGVSSFVSVGNKVDVSGNDLIRYWDSDPRTEVILLYLESFGNPRHFARIARQVSRRKPIVAVKSGRSSAGTRGTSSHTAAMASPDATVDALFHQAGVIRVDTLEELFDVANVLSHQPLPTGRNVAIVGNAGGPGVLAADACEGAGLVVPELSAGTQRQLRAVLSKEAAVSNPVDCIAIATAEQYRRVLEVVLADDEVDAVIAIFTPPLVTQAEDVAAQVAAVAASATKPILAVFLATASALSVLREGKRRVPWFAYPESAARTLGRIVPYATWRVRPDSAVPIFADLDIDRGRAIVEAALADADAPSVGLPARGAPDGAALTWAPAGVGSRWLDASETFQLLAAYGIPFVECVSATSVEEAAEAARRVGFPVAVKLDVPGLVHRSDVGGVLLGVTDAEQVMAVTGALLARHGPEAKVIVQPMAAPGVETVVGVIEEPGFGPVVMVGLGGAAIEVLGDRALSLVPITRPEAVDLIASLKAAKLLSGYRGAPVADVEALAELLCRVAQLAEHLPEVVEMDLNPVIASPGGCVVVDAKVRVARPITPEPELWRRHLR
jgi:acetyl coenzyme A synthetase (ADP forming)-like protein